jgi:polysaccharide biosynthesis protein PslH
MRILFIVPYVPSLIRVRPYNLLQNLAERGNQITLATIWTNAEERESISDLKPFCQQVISAPLPGWRSMWNCLKALPSRAPLQYVYSWNKALIHAIDHLGDPLELTSCFDVVHVEHLRGARYGLHLKKMFEHSIQTPPIVWDSVDSISLLFKQAMRRGRSGLSRSITRFEYGRTQHYEGWLVSQFDRTVVTSPRDQEAFQSLKLNEPDFEKITTIRNGVDLDYFKPDENVPRRNDTVVVSGKMSYHANVAMVRRLVDEIMPFVWARNPGIKLWIVGKDPPKNIQALKANPNITVTGTVKDLRPYLQKATVAVAPISYGTGIQNKVLEAMACGTPVVASPQAVSALGTHFGEEILVEEEPKEFADAILNLLSKPRLHEKVRRNGRTYVESNHNWQLIAAQFEEVYRETIENKR